MPTSLSRTVFLSLSVGLITAACSHCKRQAETSAPAVTQTASPEVKAAADALVAKWNEHKTVSADVRVKLNSAAGGKGETIGLGDYFYSMADGKPHLRFWSANTVNFFVSETVTNATADIVRHWSDGEFHYKYIHEPMLKKVIKMRYDPANFLQIGGRDALRDIVSDPDARLVPGERVGGLEVTVFEIRSADGSGKTRHYFDPANGVRLRLEELDSANQPTLTITLSNVKLDRELSEDIFQPVVPPEFEFVDETKETIPP